ncbi:MAG: hypothetical protein AVDCRST_MAG86-3488, partial [uncultured Truepera sp.]
PAPTPARAAISLMLVSSYPCCANRSSAAVSSAARVRRLRSCWGRGGNSSTL